MKISKNDYLKISKTLIKKLYKLGCWGKGSLYQDNLTNGFPTNEKRKVLIVAESLVKQNMLCKKPKKYGTKYYLNIEMKNKIEKIIN